MTTAILLKKAIDFAAAQGFQVRQELLDSSTAGLCEFGGKKWIFLDLSQNSTEQLHELGIALIRHAHIPLDQLPTELKQVWQGV